MVRTALLLLCALAACGDDDDATVGPDACVSACPFVSAGGCRVSDGTRCTDYPPMEPPGAFADACTQSSGTWYDDGCPAADRVGSCIFTTVIAGMTTRTAVRFYPPATVADAAAYCTTTQPNVTVEWIPG